MSDHWVVLIPEDPRHVPDRLSQERARARFAELAGHADEITVKATEDVRFFSCVENFSRVVCPSCGGEIPMDWWWAKIGGDYDGGFRLDRYRTPCCDKPYTLHEFVCDWPQGFGRFNLTAINPECLGQIDDRQKREFEEILGTPLRVIYVHI
jgi:hypothetical protein